MTTNNNPPWDPEACASVTIGPDKASVEVIKFDAQDGNTIWPASANLGTTTIVPSGFYSGSFPTTKAAEDIAWLARISAHRSMPLPLSGFVLEDLLPLGWDYIEGGDVPNWWSVVVPYPPALDAACLTPTFTRIPNHNGTGRTLLRWEFPPACSLPAFATHLPNGTGAVIDVAFTARWTATAPLPPCNLQNPISLRTLDGSNSIARWSSAPLNKWVCKSEVTNLSVMCFPTAGANTDSKKYVKGALDANFSRYPITGNTNLNGTGEYEIYIQNTGFDPINQLDVADVLPYIGDRALTTNQARGSAWSEELASAITIERYTIGSGWSAVPGSELPQGIMYGSQYNSCYLDGPLGSITADPAVAVEGQAAGCTDMSTGTAADGAKAFSFQWRNTVTPLSFGEQLRIRLNVRQLTGQADMTNGEIAWNSLAYTAIANTAGTLFSSEPIKVGLKMVDPSTTAAIGDYVWLDGNGNGRQDAGETPIEGVRVSLYDAAGQPVTQSVIIGGVPTNVPVVAYTDASGYYCFPGLTPNADYYVRLDDPTDFASGGPLSGYALTTANTLGVADDVDSDAAMGTLAGASTSRPQILSPTLAAGTQTKTYDFGFICPGSVTGYVWMDTDRGGDQTAGEMPISGVTVTLKDAATNATVAGPTTSNASGQYSFTGVTGGTYYVEFTTLPTGKIPTYKDLTGNDASDSDVNGNGRTDAFVLGSCDNLVFDLGLRPLPADPASICGTAWDDVNKDGIFDGTEPGLAGIMVQLLSNGFVLNTTTTDASGNYCFTNLDPGVAYSVAFVPPSFGNTILMFSSEGSDQDVDLATGVTTSTYTPAANYNGPDSFTYTLTDADGDVSTATVTLNVASVDDLPVAKADTFAATEDTVLNGSVAGNDTLS
ncbi:MAG TPA: SdrD B-like domain-containing protein, partial [Saprospiraceae bacterium]|nr:SdrD B-like domain-containing protein [Saprospiraceae bacterium]